MLISKSFLKIVSIVLLSFGQVIASSGEVRSQVTIQQPLTQDQIIDRWIEELKTEELPGEALEAIGKIGKPAIPKLLPLLKNPNAEVRANAAGAFGMIGKSAQSSIPDLIPLLRDRDEAVRSSAVWSLGKIGESSKSSIPLLIPMLKDPDWIVRVSV